MEEFSSEWKVRASSMTWDVDEIYTAAVEHAKSQNRELDIQDFWFLADHRWFGEALKDWKGLEHRETEYFTLDRSIAKHAVNCDEMNVAASIKRVDIRERTLAAGRHKNQKFTNLMLACEQNLMFLAREVLDKFFTFQTHAQICNFFVQKDALNSRIEDQDLVKGRLVLVGRGTGKSTLDMIDCVQWIINFPNIRIMVVTGVVDLAITFVEETKGYFLVEDENSLSNFQNLFERFCIFTDTADKSKKSKKGKKTELTCPARDVFTDHKRGATLWASSILKASTGQHCQLIKGDDTVHEKNTETPQQIQKVINKIAKIENILNVGCFEDLIGTPYAGNDLYACKLEYAKSNPIDRRVLRLPSLIRKPESIYKEESLCEKGDFFVTFPADKCGNPMLTFEHLWKLRSEKPEDFKSQQMLDPHGIKAITFALEVMHTRTVTELPIAMINYLLVDTASSNNKWSDYTVAAVVGVDYENRAYVRKIYRSKDASPTEKAKAIVDLFHEYKPKLITIEDANGSRNLEPTILHHAEALGYTQLPFDWFTADRTKGAKESRVFALEPLLTQGRLFFYAGIDCLSDLYDEFNNFGSAMHDDIPDTIAQVLRVINNLPPAGGLPPEEVRRREALKQKDYDFSKHDFEDEVFRSMVFDVSQETPISETVIPETNTDEDIIDYYGIPGFKRNR